MPKTTARIRKPARKVATSKRTNRVGRLRRTAFPVQRPEPAHDIEDLFTRNLIEAEIGEVHSGMLIQDIIYNTTPAMRSAAYKFGYSLGRHLFSKSNGRNLLPRVLESAGFGKVMYYPFTDRIVITSMNMRKRAGMDNNVHVFESGIIAGYLAAYTGTQVYVRERHCVYNDASYCQFVATPELIAEQQQHRPNAVDAVAKALTEEVGEDEGKVHESYYMLSMMPLIRQPLLEAASKLLYTAGRRAAASGDGDARSMLQRMAKHLDIDKASVYSGKDGVPTRIRLQYKPHNSMSQFIDLSTAPMIGLADGLFGAHTRVVKKLERNNRYTVELQLNH